MATKEEKRNESKNKLLLFDNQSFIVRSLAMNLELKGWDVTFVSNIDDLFLNLNQSLFDILILDIMLPLPNLDCTHVSFTVSEIDEMNDGLNTGVVLAKKIWQIMNYNDVPILFLSGRANPIPNDMVLQTKNCDYLRKPEFAKNVDLKLRKMLNP